MEGKLFEKILEYGQKKISFAEVQNYVREISNREISKFVLDEYWGVVEIEEIINDLLNNEIDNWEQFELEKKIEVIIKKFEAENLSLKETQEKIISLTGKKVDQYSLENYWKGESLEEFVKTICIKKIEDWESIDDERAVALISEIIKNPSSAILSRNGEALEIRYSKPSGTVSDLIFWNDYTPVEILKELKVDTIIKL